MNFYSLPAIFLAIISGLLSDRYGPTRIGIFSITLIIIGNLIFASSTVFEYATLERVITGIGAATISIIAAQILALWFKGAEIGTAVGIFSTAVPVGTIVAYTTFGDLGKTFGWRIPVFIPTIVAIIALITFFFFYKPAPNSFRKKSHGKQGFFSNLLKINNLIWITSLCWMWFNAE